MTENNQTVDEYQTCVNYNIKLLETGSNAKCRVCGKNIYQGQVGIKFETISTDGFHYSTFWTHPYCMIDKLIGEIHKELVTRQKKEIQKYEKISKILNDKNGNNTNKNKKTASKS